jgi:hypothetical protein
VIHPRERRWCWVRRFADGREQYLPPKVRKGTRKAGTQLAAEAWPPNPEWWRPIEPDKWQAPLPPPLPPPLVVHDGKERMVNIRARHRRRRDGDDGQTDQAAHDAAPWWWDASAIKYEPAGEVTLLMAEGRLMRAVAVAGAAAALAGPEATRERVIRDIADAAKEVEREALARLLGALLNRFEPGQLDLKDWETAMSWFAALDPPELRDKDRPAWSLTLEQQVLIWRAERRSWRFLAKLLGRSTGYVRDLYATAVERCWRVANGREPFQHARRRDAVAALRERNRSFHRSETQAGGTL